MPVIHVNTIEEFSKFLANKKGNQHVFVDFFAQWCGPCKRIAPKLEEFSETYNAVTFLKVDVDEIPEIAELYSVGVLPTFLMFKTGTAERLYQPIEGADLNKIEGMLKMVTGAIKPSADF